MPIPRVFVSSTYYDLRHVRAAIEDFVRAHGFEPVLFERGTITYDPQKPLVDSAYRDVEGCQIVVLVVGNRYGTLASSVTGDSGTAPNPVSVTMEEYRTAIRLGIPTYSFVERSVWAEYQVFRLNRDATSVRYSHEESLQVFQFVDYISELNSNNVIFTFDDVSDIITILRLQWSGLFYELLRKAGEETRMRAVEEAIKDLQDTASRLEAYSEKLVRDVSSEDAEKLISGQRQATLSRRADRLFEDFGDSAMGQFVLRFHDFDGVDDWARLVSTHASLEDFLKALDVPGKEYEYVISREPARLDYLERRDRLLALEAEEEVDGAATSGADAAGDAG